MRFRTILLCFASAGLLSAADDVLARVAAHAAQFGEVSLEIWQHPELGFHETKSSALLQQQLRMNGFDVKAGLAGMSTAFTASYGSGKPVIAILGEFDSLPGLSQKVEPKLDPVEAGAPGHGCGHNLLGSASALAVVAARTLALAGVELLENPAEVAAAHEAFEKRLAGRKWTTRIAPDAKPPLDYAIK